MAIDLSYANLQAALPTGAITVQGDDLLISVRAVLGEPTVALNNAKVSEFIAKLLEGTSQAQESFNRSNSVDLNSYPRPVPGIPQRREDGSWNVTLTYTVAIQAPVDLNLASAMPV